MAERTSRVAVVTGGSMGTGRTIAERLLADGWRVSVLDVTAPDDPLPGSACLTCDVTSRTAVRTAVNEVAERQGAIDVLVDNAGIISPRRSYLDSQDDELIRYFTRSVVTC